MHLTDLFEIKFKKNSKYDKTILFMVGKSNDFSPDMDQIKNLIEEYLELIAKYDDLSVVFDLCSFKTFSLKSVWEGISESAYYDDIVIKSVKRECIILTNQYLRDTVNDIVNFQPPPFNFKLVKNLKEAMEFFNTFFV